MDYEKKYKEALEREKKLQKTCDNTAIIGWCEYIFPELEESEDEKIRKELIGELKAQYGNLESGKRWIAWLEKQGTSYTKKDVDDAYLKGVTDTKNEIKKQYEANYQIRKDIATFIFNYKGDIKDRAKWMNYLGIKVSFVEKQGEHKPAKFKVGDWVVFNNNRNKNSIYRIEKDENYQYTLRHILGGSMPLSYSSEDMLRLWTIDDAKDGDVLAFNDNIIVIFKELYNATTFHSYCYIEDGKFDISDDEVLDWWEGDKFHPATKEQRDTLIKAMADAGYTFDFEKKGLIGIDQKYVGNSCKSSENAIEEKDMVEYKKGFECGKQRVLKYPEDFGLCKKPALSEEDEKIKDYLITYFSDIDDCASTLKGKDIVKWIKKQCDNPTDEEMKELLRTEYEKGRADAIAETQKVAWSEEDEYLLYETTQHLEDLIRIDKAKHCGVDVQYYQRDIDWLKSIKDRAQHLWMGV